MMTGNLQPSTLCLWRGSVHPDWLDYNGFRLVTKPAREFTDSQGRKRWRGDMDVEIAVDMMELAPRLDHIFLFSGDGDFRRLVEAIQAKGGQCGEP